MSKVGPEETLPVFASNGYEEVKKTDAYLLQTTTFDFGDQKFFATYWIPQATPIKGLVYLCHGYAEYISPSYDEVGEKMAKEGLLVFGHDHVGHGRSSGQRVQVSSLSDYVLPVLAHVKKAKREFGEHLPTFILGHSMGGLITINVLLADQELFKGSIFMSPLVMMNPAIATPFKKFLAGLFCKILPSFAIGGIVTEDITRDKSVVERVKNDPLIWHGGFRSLHSQVLLQETDKLSDGAALKNLKVPLMIFQGGQDRLVYPPGAQFLHDNVGSDDKKLVIHDDGFHNLYVELEDVKQSVMKDTCDWLLQHL